MPYILSFTGAYALVNQTHILAEEYARHMDWEKVKEEVFAHNLLQSKTEASTQKRFNVLSGRLKTLSEAQIMLMGNTDSQSARWLVYLGILRYHKLIAEFVLEVIRKKYLLFDYQVFESDFAAFFEGKRALNPQLETVREETRIKIKNVIFNILEECGILSDSVERRIVAPFLAAEVIEVVALDQAVHLAYFLYDDQEIASIKKQYKLNEPQEPS